jgi:hypothetical protein
LTVIVNKYSLILLFKFVLPTLQDVDISLFPFQWQVIVRDIVSKLLIVQFRAHSSPILALCFDPSGTLLVTASVHGQNINVFRIIPPPHGNESEAGQLGTYFHLYKLQRGITNAVSQYAYMLLLVLFVDFNCITFVIGHKGH